MDCPEKLRLAGGEGKPPEIIAGGGGIIIYTKLNVFENQVVVTDAQTQSNTKNGIVPGRNLVGRRNESHIQGAEDREAETVPVPGSK